MKIVVTGAAGFIGFHLSKRLISDNHNVIGIDNLNDYYDPALKKARLEILEEHPNFQFEKADLIDGEAIDRIIKNHQTEGVINLAAQAGVRYSIENPEVYIQSNLVGFSHVLEACRRQDVKHLIFASSSSVYGANENLPFSVQDNVDHPISLYAATKKANELMAHSYSSLYGLSVTGLRFFTVYGPWGRPDMALFKFTEQILNGLPIDVYNNGEMLRDFTYIDDIVESITRLLLRPATPNLDWNGKQPDPGSSFAPYRVFNIGNSSPVRLLDFIEEIEKAVGKVALKKFLPLQPGDVPETTADVEELYKAIGFRPNTDIRTGIKSFIDWYLNYYGHRTKTPAEIKR